MEKNNKPLDMPELKMEKLFYLEAICDPIIPVGDVGRRNSQISIPSVKPTGKICYTAYMLV